MAKHHESLFKYTDATLDYLKLGDEKLACMSYFGYRWVNLEAVFKCGDKEVMVAQVKNMSLVQLFEFMSKRK